MRLSQNSFTPAWSGETGSGDHLPGMYPKGLSPILWATPEVSIDDRSKIILFSDTHRGDKSAADPFACNEGLFLHALTHYYQQGFTYIELGDGDDLWQVPNFMAIQQAYPQIFELLGRFQQDQRLHLIFGNHELTGSSSQPLAKGELSIGESLGLRYRPTGQMWLLAHGHQADPWCDPVNKLNQRLGQVVYGVLKHLRSTQQAGRLSRLASLNQTVANWLEGWYHQWNQREQKKLTQHLAHWAYRQRQAIICGHTHLPFFPTSPRMPYFNTGCGIHPGYITGLEIQHGWIGLVKWWANGKGAYRRKLLDTASPLAAFA